MLYEERKPTAELTGVIRHFWSLEYEGADAEPEVILPDGCPEIVFNLSDRFRRYDGRSSEFQPSAIFSGQISRRLLIQPTGKVKLFGIRLTPTGAFVLSRIPQFELKEKIPDFRSVFGPPADRLEEAVNSVETFDGRAAIFEAFVRTRMRLFENGCAARLATEIVERAGGRVSVARLADHLNRSERSLERIFNEQVGISPKMFARIVRFQNAVRTIESTSNPSMIESALTNGYFDQSHMIRDFNEFAGESPLEFIRKKHKLSDLFTGSA